MVGRLPDARRAGRLGLRRARATRSRSSARSRPSLAASELAKLRGEPLPVGLPEIDLDAVRAAQVAVRDAVRAGSLSSAHDIAEGGLAVALAECCLAGGCGASVRAGPRRRRSEQALFGEGPGGFLLSGPREALRGARRGARAVRVIGTVGGARIARGSSIARRRLERPAGCQASARARSATPRWRSCSR